MNTETLSIKPNVYLHFFKLLDRYTPANISAKGKLYYCRYRSRRQLLKLDDERLVDIGLSREEVLKEVQQPFWR